MEHEKLAPEPKQQGLETEDHGAGEEHEIDDIRGIQVHRHPNSMKYIAPNLRMGMPWTTASEWLKSSDA